MYHSEKYENIIFALATGFIVCIIILVAAVRGTIERKEIIQELCHDKFNTVLTGSDTLQLARQWPACQSQVSFTASEK